MQAAVSGAADRPPRAACQCQVLCYDQVWKETPVLLCPHHLWRIWIHHNPVIAKKTKKQKTHTFKIGHESLHRFFPRLSSTWPYLLQKGPVKCGETPFTVFFFFRRSAVAGCSSSNVSHYDVTGVILESDWKLWPFYIILERSLSWFLIISIWRGCWEQNRQHRMRISIKKKHPFCKRNKLWGYYGSSWV